MEEKNSKRENVLSKAGNILFFMLLLLFLFQGDARSWLLRQFIATGFFNASIKKENVKKDAPAYEPTFSFTHADGKNVTTQDLKGKVVFINFWATWCPPCRAEMPSLQVLYNKLKNDSNFVFVFINEDDDVQKANAYLEKNGFTMPLARRTGDVPNEFFSGTLPTTVVIDKKGNIVLKHEGMAGYNTASFIQQLQQLL